MFEQFRSLNAQCALVLLRYCGGTAKTTYHARCLGGGMWMKRVDQGILETVEHVVGAPLTVRAWEIPPSPDSTRVVTTSSAAESENSS